MPPRTPQSFHSILRVRRSPCTYWNYGFALNVFHPRYYNKMFLLRDKDERDQPEGEDKVQLKVKLLFSESGIANFNFCMHSVLCINWF